MTINNEFSVYKKNFICFAGRRKKFKLLKLKEKNEIA